MRQEECREEQDTWLAACNTPKTAHVTAKLKALLAEAEQHARDEVVKSAMLERKLCRVLGGLEAAYDHYGKRSEPAWRGTQGARTQGRQE
jgi:hypothetical protein